MPTWPAPQTEAGKDTTEAPTQATGLRLEAVEAAEAPAATATTSKRGEGRKELAQMPICCRCAQAHMPIVDEAQPTGRSERSSRHLRWSLSLRMSALVVPAWRADCRGFTMDEQPGEGTGPRTGWRGAPGGPAWLPEMSFVIYGRFVHLCQAVSPEAGCPI